ncbi:Structural maintenance of chromosomes protein 6 [Mactra antiquata]
MKRRLVESDEPKAKRKPPNDSLDSQDDDSDVMDLSQNPDFMVDQKEAEVGIIEKVSLKNFMCHNRLDVSLGPNINFIIGNNGSGKSAIITAIVVGLGGKASTTNRGTKLDKFVKTGKQTANVEIKIRNRGPDAYRGDLYGDTITVCRKFNIDGTSGYRMLSKSGKVVSTKKDDLIKMMDQFNIQVDNPLSILNQDTSKHFLNSKSPHDKYKFFLRATQLEQIKEDYDMAEHHKEETKDIIRTKVQTLPKLEKDVLELAQKFKALTAINDLAEKMSKLKQELAWSFVIEKEKGLNPLLKALNHEESTRLPKFKLKAEEAKANLEKVNARKQELTAKQTSLSKESQQIDPDHQNAVTKLAEQKKTTRTAQMDIRQHERALQNLLKEKQSIIERIAEIQTSSKNNYEEERQIRFRKINELEEKLTTLQAHEHTTDHQLDQYRNAITKYKNDAYRMGQDQQMYQSKFEKNQRNLQALKASQGNRLKRFGQFMPQLIQTINEYSQRGRFHRKPIGPLGACLSLTDQKWALAVECCLRGLIGSFCCHDYHDEKVLEEIMHNVCPNSKFTIIVSEFKDRVYNVSDKRADNKQFPSVLDVIQYDSPMVANALIDQRTVECVLLIESGKVARQVMDPDSHTPTPRNAREAFTIDGDQVFGAPTFRYYSSNQTQAKFLKANVEEDIALFTAEIGKLKHGLDKCRQDKLQLDTEIRKNKEEERRSETRLMKIREDKRKVTMELTDLKNHEEPAPVDVATYEEEVRLLDDQISKQESDIENKRSIYKEHDAILKELTQQFREVDEKRKAMTEAEDSVKDEVGNLENEITTCRANKKHFETKLKEQEKKVKDLKEQVDKYKTEIETDIGKASSVCEKRIDTRRSPRNLESEIIQIDKQIKNEEKRRGDPAEITKQYKEKKDAYKKIKCDVKQLERFLEKLGDLLRKRFISYEDFQNIMARRATFYFITYLYNRNYRGKMHFDHKNQTLDMKIQPNESASSTDFGKDLMSLSGGERSFSTVCFIMALWEAMECPFSCLDEFDVFMDMVNRRMSMEMMIRKAKETKDRQFIFLTPQSMSNLGITSTKLMRIFKMPNPERNQSTIDFPSTSSQAT